ncbi:MAG: hypothetical protein MK180_05505 [Rhodobacteraceae bacterium]|nr:hypothetical protein [Paracoccaceae bacterium]
MKILSFPTNLLAAAAVALSGLLPATDADARGYTVRDPKTGQNVTVEVSRPGSKTSDFSRTLANLLFPPGGSNCINAYKVYTGYADTINDIIAYHTGTRFCPDERDFKILAMPCYAHYQGVHPRSEDKVASEGDKITFQYERRLRKAPWRKLTRAREPGYLYYGWGDCWMMKYIGPSEREAHCTNSFFGKDPKPGVRKMCFFERRQNLGPFEEKYFHHT